MRLPAIVSSMYKAGSNNPRYDAAELGRGLSSFASSAAIENSPNSSVVSLDEHRAKLAGQPRLPQIKGPQLNFDQIKRLQEEAKLYAKPAKPAPALMPKLTPKGM